MKKLIVTFPHIMLVVLMFLVSAEVFSQQISIPFAVTDGENIDTLKLGLDPSATDGIDAALGEAELPPPPPTGIFDARLTGEDISIPIGQGSRRDYRNGGYCTPGVRTHEIKYQVESGFTSFRISWNNIPSNITIRMMDFFGGLVVDTTFTGTGSYLVTNLFVNKLKLVVTYNAVPSVLNVRAAIEGLYLPMQDIHNAKDSCKIFLRQAIEPYNFVDSSSAEIDSLTLMASFVFNSAPCGNYYFVIRHKNGLETWSKEGGETFTQGTVMSYDFTTSSSQAYGNNLKQSGSRYCIYSGDIDQNGVIDAADKTLVVSKLGFDGYLREDLDGSRFVNAADRKVVTLNFGISKSTP